MKEHVRLWIDLPRGHEFGFPKVYIPGEHGDLVKWLKKQGYPVEELRLTTYIKFIDKQDCHKP